MENRLGIKDAIQLAHEEERISKRAALSLYHDGTLAALTPGTFHALSEIHKHLFGDIYDFAGEVRTVNLSKGGFRFASALYLGSALRAIERGCKASCRRAIMEEIALPAHPLIPCSE